MKTLGRAIPLLSACAAVAVTWLGCTGSPPQNFVQAPPGPADLGPASGLSAPPANAVVFDLKYRPQTGGESDLPYHSFWGYGSSPDEARTNTFLQDVRKKASGLYEVCNYAFTGRKWAAVEYKRRQALALYFDLNADGKLDEGERILPTRKADNGVEFITPDFVQQLEDGGQVLCRTLLQVRFYSGGAEPNCIWSPAALLEGTATLEGQPARLLLFANQPAGSFDRFGSSSYALLLGSQTNIAAGQYVSRDRLSSLISKESQFYHLTIDGKRTNGLPARVVLVKDTTPTGSLAVKLAGTNSLHTAVTSLYLQGVDDNTVFFAVTTAGGSVSLPEGTYSLSSGDMAYGTSTNCDWGVSFSKGPNATVKAGEVADLAMGHPTLTVRAVEEQNRYNSESSGSTRFKKGTRIYLEPRIVGKDQELFSRFRQRAATGGEKLDRSPKITITGPDGKQLLATTMEYG